VTSSTNQPIDDWVPDIPGVFSAGKRKHKPKSNPANTVMWRVQSPIKRQALYRDLLQNVLSKESRGEQGRGVMRTSSQ